MEGHSGGKRSEVGGKLAENLTLGGKAQRESVAPGRGHADIPLFGSKRLEIKGDDVYLRGEIMILDEIGRELWRYVCFDPLKKQPVSREGKSIQRV